MYNYYYSNFYLISHKFYVHTIPVLPVHIGYQLSSLLYMLRDIILLSLFLCFLFIIIIPVVYFGCFGTVVNLVEVELPLCCTISEEYGSAQLQREKKGCVQEQMSWKEIGQISET